MCGIIGIISNHQSVAGRIVDGLKRLEYRGYDSAGVATLEAGKITTRRAAGKIAGLQAAVAAQPLHGNIGIGHIRWATHGAPDEHNAHPISNGRVSVVHNGIIENFAQLRERLTAKGHVFHSQTDTESIVHLITDHLDAGLSPQEALQKTLAELEGAFAIGVLFAGHDLLFGARRGSPLVLGIGQGEMFLGSDALGLAPFTDQMLYLEEGDWAILKPDTYQVFDKEGQIISRPTVHIPTGNLQIAKDGFAHFMLKEIYEQPSVIGQCLSNVLDPATRLPTFASLSMPPITQETRLNLVACGTSHYAAMVAKYWFENFAGLPVNVDMASEFRYRKPPLRSGGICLFISQSGETADTLAALKYAKAAGQFCIAVVNVATSSMAREANAVILTDAGVEVGVASTKAFTCQLVILAALSLVFALQTGHLPADQVAEHVEALTHVPTQMGEILLQAEHYSQLARQWLASARDILYIGRGVHYPLALEGALKLKELSYIHAEGFPAGELKHGPIALIDQDLPVIVLAPHDELFDKTLANAFEVMARGARVILLTDKIGAAKVAQASDHMLVVTLPESGPLTAPLLYTPPLQLLAYYTALHKGTDVDQPRNLAKSVTVE
jgi:glucosamine--fructose-6-phosphate aminotransferase (isomerizing)